MRCPSCSCDISLADGQQAADVTCPSCGSTFQSENTAGQSIDAHATRLSENGQSSTSACDHGPLVPGYEIVGLLGRGGMGIVYKARHIQLNRIVALKVVFVDSATGGDELARFQREAEAMASLRHPNIVPIYEVGRVGMTSYLTMEFVEGGTLASLIDAKPQEPGTAAQLVLTLACATNYAHEHGVIHRDLKPSNILIGSETVNGSASAAKLATLPAGSLSVTPKIADFGLAKRLQQGSKETVTGTVLGTPSYMAPEQAAGKVKDIGRTADVYALGAILYECISGQPPFLASTQWELLQQVMNQEPVPPSRLNQRVPRDLETICLKCLAKDPRARYRDAGKLAEDLRRFIVGEPVRARPIGTAGRVTRWCRRNPWKAGSASLALALAMGLATVFVRGQWEAARRDLEAKLENPPEERLPPPTAKPPTDCVPPPAGVRAANEYRSLQILNHSGRALRIHFYPKFFEAENR